MCMPLSGIETDLKFNKDENHCHFIDKMWDKGRVFGSTPFKQPVANEPRLEPVNLVSRTFNGSMPQLVGLFPH